MNNNEMLPADECLPLPVEKIEDRSLSLSLKYDEQTDLVHFFFFRENEAVAEIKMLIQDYESFINDGVRLIKDINLLKAEEFKEKQNKDGKTDVETPKDSNI